MTPRLVHSLNRLLNYLNTLTVNPPLSADQKSLALCKHALRLNPQLTRQEINNYLLQRGLPPKC